MKTIHSSLYLVCVLLLSSISLLAAEKPPIGEIYARFYDVPRHLGSNFMAFQNAFLSMLLVMGLVICIQYWNNRRRSYLYYCIYLLFVWIYFARAFPPYFYFLFSDLDGFIKFYNFWMPKYGDGFSHKTELILSFLMTGSYFLFIRDFFDLKNESSKMYWGVNQLVTIIFTISMFMALVLILTGNYVDGVPLLILKHICFLPAIWLIPMVLRMKLPCANLILIGSSMLVLGSIVVGALRLAGDELNGKRVYLEMAVLLELLFFMAALGKLSRLIIEEKINLEHALTMMEQKSIASPVEVKDELLIKLDSLIQKRLSGLTQGEKEVKFTIPHFAHELHMGHSTLLRRIRELTNKNIEEYILDYRLHHAHSLVLNSKDSFSEIADQIGFSDGSAFSKAFRKKFGYTPSSLRSNGKAQQNGE